MCPSVEYKAVHAKDCNLMARFSRTVFKRIWMRRFTSQTNADGKPQSSTKEIRCKYIVTFCQLPRLENRIAQSWLLGGLVHLRLRMSWANERWEWMLPSFCHARPVFSVAALKHCLWRWQLWETKELSSPDCWLWWRERYVVESIVNQQALKGEQEYFLKWLRCKQPTGEPGRFFWTNLGRRLFSYASF